MNLLCLNNAVAKRVRWAWAALLNRLRVQFMENKNTLIAAFSLTSTLSVSGVINMH